ncbi:hypothetical protein BX666DRAFT_2023292 [Dichotomocladium elegans]|nr:hypothetical protein BX666DRAFT_2023292 [Dichotomocladium elegans]
MTSAKRTSLGVHLMSTRNRLELQEMFDAIDKDQDGKVSLPELEEMLHTAGLAANQSTVTSMLQAIHIDNDGNIGFEEFVKLMRPTLSNPHRLTKKQQELKEAFDAFDTDGSGCINAEELMTMMKQLGDGITLDEAQKMIAEADSDKSGGIDFAEFSRMMGIRPPDSYGPASPTSPMSPSGTADGALHHHHHRYSMRKFFCKECQHQNTTSHP